MESVSCEVQENEITLYLQKHFLIISNMFPVSDFNFVQIIGKIELSLSILSVN